MLRVCVQSLSVSVLAIACIGTNVQSETSPVNTCWSDSELAAKASEKRTRRIKHSYTQPSDNHELAPFEPTPSALRGSIRRVTLPKNKKWIALTLDFCEQTHEIAGYDGAILDYLRSEKIPATLFVGGKWMQTHGERTQQMMAEPLFELANHAEAHRNLRRLSGSALRREIVGPQATYESLRQDLEAKACFAKAISSPPLAPRLRYFRFPFGACNAAALNAVNDAGLLAIQWDFSSWDSSRGQSARRIAARMVREVRAGSIILAHGNGRGYNTAAALQIAVPKLRQRGFKFVTVSTLLEAGTPVIKPRCYNARPGDTDRYDRLFRRRPKKKVPRGSSFAR